MKKGIKSNLPAKFYEFWKEEKFIDFTLKTKNEDIKCHQLILSLNSNFFLKKFSSHSINGDSFIVQFDPNGNFKDVITFFYTKKINVTVQNIAQIAAIGEYYEINGLFTYIDHAFTELFTKDNVYTLIKSFCSNKVSRYHNKIINVLVSNFDEFRMENIIKASDTKLLSDLLKELPIYTIDEKVQILDKFTNVHGNHLSDTEKKDLTSIYNFSEDNDSYRLLIFNQCNWMDSSIQRNLLSTIINRRKEKIDFFTSEYQQSLENTLKNEADSNEDIDSKYFTGKWGTFSYISDISLLQTTNEIDLIDYIRTFNGISNRINPLELGFIDVDHSEPIAPQFGGLNIFGPDFYFASDITESNNIKISPYIHFNIGSFNNFFIQSLQLEPVQNEQFKPKRPLVGPIILTLAKNVIEGPEDFCCYIDNPNDLYSLASKTDTQPSSSIKITMVGENSSGGYVFRFSYPKIIGMFVFSFTKEE